MIFFDSHGGAWTPCPVDHPSAEPFGPTAVARRCTAAELEAEGLDPDRPYDRAWTEGRIDHDSIGDGWDRLVPRVLV